MKSPSLTALSLPIPWAGFGFPDPLQTRSTTLAYGDIGWSWEPVPPAFHIAECATRPGTPVPGWDLDHVVLLVPDLEMAVATFLELELSPRLRIEIRGRPTAFFRVGPLLEVIESPVRAPALFGIALVTEEPLEVVALRWRAMGRDVSDPKPAIQPGRRVLTVRDVEAGLAVISPDTQVHDPGS